MNLAEGIKRIYITVACLVLVISASVHYENRPTEERLSRKTATAIKDAIAARNNQSTFVELLRRSDAKFVEEICSPPVQNRYEEIVDLCNRYNFEKTELPKALTYHAAYSAVILVLAALAARLLWILMAWIVRGFISDKKSF